MYMCIVLSLKVRSFVGVCVFLGVCVCIFCVCTACVLIFVCKVRIGSTRCVKKGERDSGMCRL